jgi:molybdenum cofactor cytidylyltransferase
MSKDSNIVTAIILAAGSSSRMGRSKQLLPVGGQALLRRVTSVSVESHVAHTLVVLGHNEMEHQRVIRDLPVAKFIHSKWEKGIGSSLKSGLQFILEFFPDTQSILVMVSDQPYIDKIHINRLIEGLHSSEHSIAASAYSGTLGVPALFDQSHVKELLTLDDDAGAKSVIEKNLHEVTPVEFMQGSIDLDTEEDYKTYMESVRQ